MPTTLTFLMDAIIFDQHLPKAIRRWQVRFWILRMALEANDHVSNIHKIRQKCME